jgi:hypothetical protein
MLKPRPSSVSVSAVLGTKLCSGGARPEGRSERGRRFVGPRSGERLLGWCGINLRRRCWRRLVRSRRVLHNGRKEALCAKRGRGDQRPACEVGHRRRHEQCERSEIDCDCQCERSHDPTRSESELHPTD